MLRFIAGFASAFALLTSATVLAQSPMLSDGGLDIFVGRELELRKLENFLTKAMQGCGRMIFITGEPGIGKTALSNAFCE